MRFSNKYLLIFTTTSTLAAVAMFIYSWNYYNMPDTNWKEETIEAHVHVQDLSAKPVRGGFHKVAHFTYTFEDSTYDGTYIFHRTDEQCGVGDSLKIVFEKEKPSHYNVRGVAYKKPNKGVNIDSLSQRFTSSDTIYSPTDLE